MNFAIRTLGRSIDSEMDSEVDLENERSDPGHLLKELP
jgi:hypothetical protein